MLLFDIDIVMFYAEEKKILMKIIVQLICQKRENKYFPFPSLLQSVLIIL